MIGRRDPLADLLCREPPRRRGRVSMVGDRVCYTHDALQTHGSMFGGLCGTITAVIEHAPGWTLATVCWAPAAYPDSTVNIEQLCLMFSADAMGA